MKQKSNIKSNKKILQKKPGLAPVDILKIMNQINFEINNKALSTSDNEENKLEFKIEPQINLNYDKNENKKK